MEKKEDMEFVEFTKVCGDCGRRFKQKYRMDGLTEKEALKLMKMYYKKYDLCCNKCSQKRVNG